MMARKARVMSEEIQSDRLSPPPSSDNRAQRALVPQLDGSDGEDDSAPEEEEMLTGTGQLVNLTYESSDKGDNESDEELSESEEDGQSQTDGGQGDTQQSAQEGLPDPGVLLTNLPDLDREATHTLKYFLTSNNKYKDAPIALEELIKIYKNENSPYIDSEALAKRLNVEKSMIDLIAKKANLAFLTTLIRKDSIPKYFLLGNWEQKLSDDGIYDAITNDDANFRFVMELRTQIYILGSASVFQERPDWGLLAIFCRGVTDFQQSVAPSESFKKRFSSFKVKGWGSITAPSDEYRRIIESRVFNLRGLTTTNKNGGLTPDVQGLQTAFPWKDFQDVYLDWLKPAYKSLRSSREYVTQVLNHLKDHGSPPPSSSSSRRDRSNSAALSQAVSVSALRNASHSIDSLSTMKGLKKIKAQSSSNGQHMTAHGLRKPSSKTLDRPHSSGSPAFNFNQTLVKAKAIMKENTVPPRPPTHPQNADASSPKPRLDPRTGQRRMFIDAQPNATKLSFSQEEDVVESTGSKRVRPRNSSEETTDDDFHESTAPSKKARLLDPVYHHCGNKFEHTSGASRPKSPPRVHRSYSPAGLPQSPTPSPEYGSAEDFEPFIPRIRREWTDAEVEKLINAIATIGPNWAKIRDGYFGGTWTNVNIKDKARNLKFDFLKNLQRLPRGFEQVTFDKGMRDRLLRQGVHYEPGRREGERVKPRSR